MPTLDRILPILLCAAWFLAGSTASTSATRSGTNARFVSSSCPFPVGFGLTASKSVHCGYLIVPEDRKNPKGRTIKLAVAIFKSMVRDPAPDPVIYLGGGPGDPVLGTLGRSITVSNERAIVGDRDLVLIDQRGTGYSRPALACPAVARLASFPPLSVERQPVTTALTGLDHAFRQCHDALVRKGIDLSAYNTPENAADIADLRTALGYRSVNLYGISYGTRLALTIMRDYPQGIRSVVLDSVLPPQDDYASLLRSVEPAFTTLFQGCARAPTCSRTFPHLQQLFDRLVAQLDTKPLLVKIRSGDQLLSGYWLSQLLYEALYNWHNLPVLPKMLYQIHQGKPTIAAQIIPELQSGGKLASWGMNQSVMCSEDLAYVTPADLKAAVHALPSPLRADILQPALNALKVCSIWHVKVGARSEKQPVHSGIPTLVLDGQYDPATPPAYGQLVLTTLSHGYRVVFPGLSHGIRFAQPCPASITWAFLDHPTRKPDASCTSSLVPPFS